ncbi:MAG: hypothetical protein U0Y82_08675 [Thermoleophilia bacterium]
MSAGRIDPEAPAAQDSGARMLALMRETMDLPRSLTGEGCATRCGPSRGGCPWR